MAIAVRPTGQLRDDGSRGEGECRADEGRRRNGEPEQHIGAEADHGRAEHHLQRPEAEDIGCLLPDPREREVETDVEQKEDHAKLGEHLDRVGIPEDGVARRTQREPDREVAHDRAQSDVPGRHHGDDPQREQQNDRIDRQKQLVRVRHRRLNSVRCLVSCCRGLGVDALAALGVRVVLRSLAAVEHAVVAHHAHAAQPGAIGHRELVLEAFGCRVVVP